MAICCAGASQVRVVVVRTIWRARCTSRGARCAIWRGARLACFTFTGLTW
ncbi:hypothetical protein [Novosphingobium sp. EMRT-2]|nr:hypothetical protein [Novosphingobium sp. EMRT-2]